MSATFVMLTSTGNSITISNEIDYYADSLPVGKGRYTKQTSVLPGFNSNITDITLTTNIDENDVLSSFVNSILSNCKSLDSDISKLIDDNFWDLV